MLEDDKKGGFSLKTLFPILVGVISLIVIIPTVSAIMNKTVPRERITSFILHHRDSFNDDKVLTNDEYYDFIYYVDNDYEFSLSIFSNHVTTPIKDFSYIRELSSVNILNTSVQFETYPYFSYVGAYKDDALYITTSSGLPSHVKTNYTLVYTHDDVLPTYDNVIISVKS